MRTFAIAAALVTVITILAVPGRCHERPKDRNPIMQQKLVAAQKLLEGLAVKDFDQIERNAEQLSLLSKRAEWMVLKTPDYIRSSDDFRRNATIIQRMAREKNLDGSALGYVQLTMNCVNCHKYVRETRVAKLD